MNRFRPALSAREKEILALIAKGLRSKQIAATLDISKYTVGNHRKNMLKKRGAKNMTELLMHNSYSFPK